MRRLAVTSVCIAFLAMAPAGSAQQPKRCGTIPLPPLIAQVKTLNVTCKRARRVAREVEAGPIPAYVLNAPVGVETYSQPFKSSGWTCHRYQVDAERDNMVCSKGRLAFVEWLVHP